VTKYFERWWQWAGQKPNLNSTRLVFDPQFQVHRTVPCWSQKVAALDRCKTPFESVDTQFNAATPMNLRIDGAESSTYITGSPAEIADAKARTFDEQGLVNTITSASTSVSLSVMDLIPSNLYGPPAQALWWGALVNPLLVAATSKGVTVRLLVSKWAHTNGSILPYLLALQAMGNACSEGTRSSSYAPKCTGSLSIKVMTLPGWDKTVGPDATYPPFSRVNHAKYIITDKRFNVGTSNMAWGYFYTTAGTSFNSDHPGLRHSLQAAFDRDWNSPYAEMLAPKVSPSGMSCCYSKDTHCETGAVCCKSQCNDPSTCSYSQSGCAGEYGAKHHCEWKGSSCIVGPPPSSPSPPPAPLTPSPKDAGTIVAGVVGALGMVAVGGGFLYRRRRHSEMGSDRK
jgi:phospholipase D3/4